MKVRAEIDFDLIDYLDIDDFGGNKYLIGCGFIHNDSHIVLDNGDQFPIKKDTRAIHFEDMIDREGTEIFASLSEDGKGGDIVEYMLNRFKKAISISRYKDKKINYAQKEVKVIGIEE